MQTFAQELSSLARHESEKNGYINKITNNLYCAVIRDIKVHRCVWNNTFTTVNVSVPDIILHEPVVEYNDLSYAFNKDCESYLAEKFMKDGFKLISISLNDRIVSHVVLEVLNNMNS